MGLFLASLTLCSNLTLANTIGTISNLDGDFLNVRTGAGTSYQIIDFLEDGNTIEITNSTQDENGTIWYKINHNGNVAYVSSEFVDTSFTLDTTENKNDVSIGTSANNDTTYPSPISGSIMYLDGDYLNIRNAPGTQSKIIGYFKEYDNIQIVGESTYLNDLWYKVVYNNSQAYIHSAYVNTNQKIEENDIPIDNSNVESENTYINQVAIISGLDGDILNIRSGPGISYSRLGTFVEGSTANITGTTTDSNGETWYSINYNNGTAYIHSQYAIIQTEEENNNISPTEPTPSGTEPKPGKVINLDFGDMLNIRLGPGTSYSVLGCLEEYQIVDILGESNDQNNTKWYKIQCDDTIGYVHSYYITLDISYIDAPITTDPSLPPQEYSKAIISNYTTQAINYANDDSHGYRAVPGDNAGYGVTSSFDCGGLITRSLWDTGVLPKNKFYEPNSGYEWTLLNYGFQKIAYNYNNLEFGDILYYYGHTAIYIGNNQLVAANWDCDNPEEGDQSGHEVSVENMYGNWEYIFRYSVQ